MEYESRRKELIAALRSGKYKQGRLALSTTIDNEICYCCLGVACTLMVDKGLLTFDIYRYAYDNATGLLPVNATKYYGLNNSSGSFIITNPFLNKISPELREKLEHALKNYGHLSLATLNDKKFSFNEIADVIEAEPEELYAQRA